MNPKARSRLGGSSFCLRKRLRRLSFRGRGWDERWPVPVIGLLWSAWPDRLRGGVKREVDPGSPGTPRSASDPASHTTCASDPRSEPVLDASPEPAPHGRLRLHAAPEPIPGCGRAVFRTSPRAPLRGPCAPVPVPQAMSEFARQVGPVSASRAASGPAPRAAPRSAPRASRHAVLRPAPYAGPALDPDPPHVPDLVPRAVPVPTFRAALALHAATDTRPCLGVRWV